MKNGTRAYNVTSKASGKRTALDDSDLILVFILDVRLLNY
jgi:hypothetical protein